MTASLTDSDPEKDKKKTKKSSLGVAACENRESSENLNALRLGQYCKKLAIVIHTTASCMQMSYIAIG